MSLAPVCHPVRTATTASRSSVGQVEIVKVVRKRVIAIPARCATREPVLKHQNAIPSARKTRNAVQILALTVRQTGCAAKKRGALFARKTRIVTAMLVRRAKKTSVFPHPPFRVLKSSVPAPSIHVSPWSVRNWVVLPSVWKFQSKVVPPVTPSQIVFPPVLAQSMPPARMGSVRI